MPLVSVICLTYNHERFVAEALRGLFAQTYSNLEIIITDDASTDSTAEVIARELASDPNRTHALFIRHERNLGEVGRQNTLHALARSRGQFLVVTSGDDEMYPNMVESMVRRWLTEDVSLVTANAIYMDEHSNDLGRYYREPGAPYDESFETLARDGANVVCFGAAMGFERQLYEEFGWQPKHLKTYDILLPFFAYLSKGARFIPEPLLRYRVHQSNASLSLEVESKVSVDRLLAEEHIFYIHLAHAFYMENELARLQEADPPRFSATAKRILPLLSIQEVEMARKLVRTRIALDDLGVARLGLASLAQPK